MYQKLMDTAIPLAKVFRIIPSFCFCYRYNILLRRFFMLTADLKRELNRVISWSMAYSIVKKTKNEKDVLKLKYLGGDMIYLGVESVVYILILVFIEIADKIFSKCITSNINPKNEIQNVQKHNKDNNTNAERGKKDDSIEQRKVNIYPSNNNNIKNEVDFNNSRISIPDNANDCYVKNEIIKAKSTKETHYAIKIINLIKDYYGGPF